MVVFTCNHCGDSLQKPRVEKHYQTVCNRRGENLTCVDCLKDFRGREYVTHIKCLTEDERYAAKGSMQYGVAKKGELKQETWTEMIQSIIENETLSAPLKKVMDSLVGYVNVPRKKQRFINFVVNNLGGRINRNEIEGVWDIIEKYKNGKQEDTKTNEDNGKRQAELNEEIEAQVPVKKKKSKKDKNCEDTNAEIEPKVLTKKMKCKDKHCENGKDVPIENKDKNCENTATNNQVENTNGTEDAKNGKDDVERATNGKLEDSEEKFSFEDKILEVLATKKQLALKKLQKKVLKAYIKHRELEEVTEKHIKKYDKRLKKMTKIEIKNDLVVLL